MFAKVDLASLGAHAPRPLAFGRPACRAHKHFKCVLVIGHTYALTSFECVSVLSILGDKQFEHKTF